MQAIISRQEAREKGLTHYFTGKACRNGHASERLVSGGRCVECRKALCRKWREANAEVERAKNKERVRRSYAENPEKYRSASRRWRDRNLDVARQRTKEWRHDNQNRVREYKKEVYWANPEKARAEKRVSRLRHALNYNARTSAWKKANPNKVRASTENRRAKKRQASGSHSASDVKRILIRQGKRCVYCKASLDAGYHVDHIVPLAKGGRNGPDNLQCLCPTCNMSKGAKMPEEFARSIGMLL